MAARPDGQHRAAQHGRRAGPCHAGLRALLAGLNKLEIDERTLAADLDAAWEVLAEPIQTVMRRFGVAGAYEKLRELTRGQAVTAQALHDLILSLEIPQAEKDRLLALTPGSYLGLAAVLARRV
ncbi:hypothetical protein [Verminephrobacter aporrectodeae]|uniref:hypothetical protein n=1 Tax=Verminephrobacter aporrectodeae TaxID=1110389 RepID=UPI001F3590AF|nr:hypothetical protein [Verminephrobacter aporrectodeae]